MDLTPPSTLAAEPAPPWRRLLVSRSVHLLVAIVLLGVAAGAWLHSAGGIGGLRVRFGLLAAVIVIPIHVVVAISPLPSEMVAFGNGAVFGVWAGTLLSWLGWMTSALLHYALVRRAAIEIDLDRRLARLPRWLRRFPVDHPVFLIGARYVPYGPQLVSTVAGAFRVPWTRFAWCQAIAILPVALFFAALANRLIR